MIGETGKAVYRVAAGFLRFTAVAGIRPAFSTTPFSV
jgi:hypothetical protein